MAVADLPLEKRLVKQCVPPQTPRKNRLVSISSKELSLLGELVNSYDRHIILHVSFRSKCQHYFLLHLKYYKCESLPWSERTCILY